jgi:predicted nucleotide-binding protein
MARRPTSSSEPPPANLSPDQMRAGIERLRRRIAELTAFDVSLISKRADPGIVALETSIEETLQRVFGAGTLEMRRYSSAATLHQRVVAMSATFGRGNGGPSAAELQREFSSLRARSVALLEQAVRGLEEEISERDQLDQPPVTKAAPERSPRKVFLVHGHDEAALHAVARFLEQLELEAIVLREQPDQGRTIIEKFEDCANQVGFAVVLMTPDDIAASASAPASATRARQNVIFELGYFAGKLGRGRACLLRKGNVEIPSDLYGVIYTDFDDADGWKLKLVREFKAAKLDFDANRMWT